MNSSQVVFQKLVSTTRETQLLASTADALEWDERTGLPQAAGDYRAQQVTLLRGIVHQRRTSSEIGDWLEHLSESPLAGDQTTAQGATIHRMREDYERDCKLPQKLVEALASACVRGQQAWDAARKADAYDDFLPTLREIIRLKREAAKCLAKEGQSFYDALLDEYEPGAQATELTEVLGALRRPLVELIQKIGNAPKKPNREILQRAYPIDVQRTFSRLAAESIGFDFSRGRLDETSHPFCTSLGPDDCRILTRYQEDWFPGGLYGTLHEAGHGMYDQGLPKEWYGLPPGSYVSLGIHESQSRLWENLVGRSSGFCSYFFPLLQEAFPTALDGVSHEAFHFAVNSVEPSLIRVEADEATYNLHIIVRFELESGLFNGDLDPEDLPEAWNSKYEEFLGIRPPTNRDGVLQDVHWSAGLFGYFPTYTLGNIYAAQLYQTAERDLGPLNEAFSRGEFAPLLDWLRSRIHVHGRTYQPSELIAKATGQALDSTPLIASLTQRYAELYGI